jgi:hypothetical protein
MLEKIDGESRVIHCLLSNIVEALNILVDDYNERHDPEHACETCGLNEKEEYLQTCLECLHHVGTRDYWEPRDPEPRRPEGAQWDMHEKGGRVPYYRVHENVVQYYNARSFPYWFSSSTFCLLDREDRAAALAEVAEREGWEWIGEGPKPEPMPECAQWYFATDQHYYRDRKGEPQYWHAVDHKWKPWELDSASTVAEFVRCDPEEWHWVGSGPDPRTLPEPPAEVVPEGAEWKSQTGVFFRASEVYVEFFDAHGAAQWRASDGALPGRFPDERAARYALIGYATENNWTRVDG